MDRTPEPEREGYAEAYIEMARHPLHQRFVTQDFATRALFAYNSWTGKKPDRVLGVGCGPGFVEREIADMCPKANIVGIDISPEMIEKAEELSEGRSRLSFQLLDASRMDFQDFDLVTSLHVIPHEVEPKEAEKILRNMYRATKLDGGVLYLQDIQRPSSEEELAYIMSEFGVYGPEGQHIFESSLKAGYTRDEFRELIENSGIYRIPRHHNGKVFFNEGAIVHGGDDRKGTAYNILARSTARMPPAP